jgi:endo-1,4-beta-D-glucanase Y
MHRKLGWMIGLIALICGASQAALLPYGEPKLKYPAYSNQDARLLNVWRGFKTRFIRGGEVLGTDVQSNPMVTSEGQATGMLLAVWMNDQAAFDSLWKATESGFWNTGSRWYNWTKGNSSFSGGAEVNICGALIFASALVDLGYWVKPAGTNYKDKAIVVLKSIEANVIDKTNNYRINSWPGAGDGIRNPSYHMPQWYPIFEEFAAVNNVTGMDWDAAAKGAFDLIETQPNSKRGMARNYSNGSGGTSSGGTSWPNSYDMGLDAIRVPYHMGMAAIWHKSKLPRAANWCESVWANGSVNPEKPGMYRVDAAALWGWDDGVVPGEYEECISRAMWATAAVAVHGDDASSASALSTLGRAFSSKHLVPGMDHLEGAATDTLLSTFTGRNYFAQAYGLLGALALYGRAWNVWDDLKHVWVVPDTGTSFVDPLTATPATIQQTPLGSTPAASQISTITATLSKSVSWTLRVKGRTTGAVYVATGTGTQVSIEFHSLRKSLGTTQTFGLEIADVRLLFNGLDTTANTSCKATLTITGNPTAVAPRAVRGDGSVRWVAGGLELQDPAWRPGDRVQVRILDLGGRVMQSSDAVLASAQAGVQINTPLDASAGVRVLELGNGAIRRRYVLSPNP